MSGLEETFEKIQNLIYLSQFKLALREVVVLEEKKFTDNLYELHASLRDLAGDIRVLEWHLKNLSSLKPEQFTQPITYDVKEYLRIVKEIIIRCRQEIKKIKILMVKLQESKIL